MKLSISSEADGLSAGYEIPGLLMEPKSTTVSINTLSHFNPVTNPVSNF
jgi:hypothetical protein